MHLNYRGAELAGAKFQGFRVRGRCAKRIWSRYNRKLMAKLGFLGLGLMGYPMARNLLPAGHEVALWSNTVAKAQKLASEEKGVFCSTPKDVAARADVIFLCVGDTEMA